MTETNYQTLEAITVTTLVCLLFALVLLTVHESRGDRRFDAICAAVECEGKP